MHVAAGHEENKLCYHCCHMIMIVMNDRSAAIISMATIMYTYHQCQCYCYCCCHTGYVPQDKPGTAGYYTPRSSALYANDCFDHADCTSRNPVMSRLNGELHSNPFRHRTARKLHVRGWYLKVPAPLVAPLPCIFCPLLHPLPFLSRLLLPNSHASPTCPWVHLLLSVSCMFILPLSFPCFPPWSCLARM